MRGAEVRAMRHRGLPVSRGEQILQEWSGTAGRAANFYDNQMTGQLTAEMRDFISRMEMAFISTSNAAGQCDCSFRAGPPGFTRVLGDRVVAYPEYRGNGVKSSLGNIMENPHIGMFFVDFTQDLIGLHINGKAQILDPGAMRALDPDLPEPDSPGRQPEHWVLTTVTEAFGHCSRHIPKLVPGSRVGHWGKDNPRPRGGDYFGVRRRAGLGTLVARRAS